MFICMPKVKFIIHFFLEILHFKNFVILLADSIWAHNWRPRVLRDMRLVLKYNENISFHFRLLPRKTNGNIFQKIQKTLLQGHIAILAFFAQIWAKMNFSGKKLSQFLNIPIIYHNAKNLKKPICYS